MRSRWIFLTASLALALPALPVLAQPADHPYFPLHTGDMWIHDVYGDPGGHRTTEVLGWEGEGDEAFWRVGVSFAPFDGSAPTESECAVRIVAGEEGDAVEVTTLAGEGCVGIEVRNTLPTSGALEDVSITGQPRQLHLGMIRESISGGPNQPPADCKIVRYGENVGTFDRTECRGWRGGGEYLTQHLVYAEVGGATYGVHPDEFFASYDPMQYMPLAVGNRWTYAVQDPRSSPSTYLLDYLITGFDESTGRYALTLTRFEEGEVAAAHSCEIWMDPSGRIQIFGPDDCVLGPSPSPQRWSFRMIGASTFETYEISGIPYDLLTLDFYFSPPLHYSGQSFSYTRYQGAHGIGLLYYRDRWFAGSAGLGPTYTLLFADTGEAVYGVNPVASEDAPSAPDQRLSLSGHPNPFSGSAEIAFHLPESGAARLAVYDVLGREEAVLAEGWFDAGPHTVRLDGTGLPSGLYLVRLIDGTGAVETQRVTHVK